MTNAHAILIGFGMIAAAIWTSNTVPPAGAQATGPVIPPVEGFVPSDAASANGPWHLWRMNRHTGQISFCTAEVSVGQATAAQATQAVPQSQSSPVLVECTKTSTAM